MAVHYTGTSNNSSSHNKLMDYTPHHMSMNFVVDAKAEVTDCPGNKHE